MPNSIVSAVPPVLHSLLPRLMETANALLQEVQEQYSKQNYEQAARAAHSLKGTAMSFSLKQLQQIATALQNAAQHSGNTKIIVRTVSEAETFIRQLDTEIQRAGL